MKRYLVLIILAVFVVPISAIIPIEGTTVWYSQFLALFCILNIGVSLVLWKFNEYISLLTLVSLYSGIITARHIPVAIVTIVIINLCCLACYGISLLDKKSRKYIIWAIFGIAVFQGLYVIVQYLNMDPFFTGFGTFMKPGRISDTVGLNGSHNQIGIYLASTLPVILHICPYLLPLSIFGLWNSTTSCAVIAASIVGTFYVFNVKRKVFKTDWRVLTVVVFIISGVVFFNKFEGFSKSTFEERITLYRSTITQVSQGKAVAKNGNLVKIYACNPWFGFGLTKFQTVSFYTQGFIKDIAYKYFGEKQKRFPENYFPKHAYRHAHNDFLEFFFETGYIGGTILLLLIMDFFFSFFKAHKTKLLILLFSCILAQFICSLWVFTVHTAVNGFMLVLYYGLYQGELRCHKNQ